MRTSCVCLVLGLVLLVAWTSEAQPQAPAIPEKCCFNFIDFPIPRNRIVSAVQTSIDCPVKAYLVTTHKGEFCVQPDAPWLKKVL
ncbi:C-C motif chemokine 13-like [Xyrauchen texanus]|uniref:C-C motif chemokine 13-like n=1 Tax=Xyrauchen texanus TaxID=154827 RepID=UPI002242142F|nr:C-C motif chemokine 13-like [Xyrauchen texanus]